MRWLRAAFFGGALVFSASRAQAQRRHGHGHHAAGATATEAAPPASASPDEAASAPSGAPAGSSTTDEAASAPSEAPASAEAASAAPEGEAASDTAEEAPWWRFAVDVGGGLGMSVLSGDPEYAEYRVYAGSNTPTCGPMNTFVCQPLARAGMSYEGNIALTVRVNTLRRVGFALTMRFQPDAANVSPLASLFFGARMYISLTANGFVKRGLAVSTFLGSGVGQMQARPGVLMGSVPSAHVMSGLNNAHLGLRVEYAFPIFHLGAEVTLNAQFPNLLFVADLQGFVGLHF